MPMAAASICGSHRKARKIGFCGTCSIGGRDGWGLVPSRCMALQEARAKALDARRKRHEGIDPMRRGALSGRASGSTPPRPSRSSNAPKLTSPHTGRMAQRKAQVPMAGDPKHLCLPDHRRLPVQAVDTGLVLKVLEPIWAKKPETAGRVRQRIENILDFAKVRGYREGENPARWRGHLDKLLPARSRVRQVEHLAALPYKICPFSHELAQRDAFAARGLEFLILTAGRTGEVIGARWSEIDLLDKTWTVPANRMKAHREHRVPLSARALAILA